MTWFFCLRIRPSFYCAGKWQCLKTRRTRIEGEGLFFRKKGKFRNRLVSVWNGTSGLFLLNFFYLMEHSWSRIFIAETRYKNISINLCAIGPSEWTCKSPVWPGGCWRPQWACVSLPFYSRRPPVSIWLWCEEALQYTVIDLNFIHKKKRVL